MDEIGKINADSVTDVLELEQVQQPGTGFILADERLRAAKRVCNIDLVKPFLFANCLQ